MEILICDYDKECCERIEKWILDYGKRENVDVNVDICYGVESVIKRLDNSYWFDLIFIEVEFPKNMEIV